MRFKLYMEMASDFQLLMHNALGDERYNYDLRAIIADCLEEMGDETCSELIRLAYASTQESRYSGKKIRDRFWEVCRKLMSELKEQGVEDINYNNGRFHYDQGTYQLKANGLYLVTGATPREFIYNLQDAHETPDVILKAVLLIMAVRMVQAENEGDEKSNDFYNAETYFRSMKHMAFSATGQFNPNRMNQILILIENMIKAVKSGAVMNPHYLDGVKDAVNHLNIMVQSKQQRGVYIPPDLKAKVEKIVGEFNALEPNI